MSDRHDDDQIQHSSTKARLNPRPSRAIQSEGPIQSIQPIQYLVTPAINDLLLL